jgi:hypothetical protein
VLSSFFSRYVRTAIFMSFPLDPAVDGPSKCALCLVVLARHASKVVIRLVLPRTSAGAAPVLGALDVT